MVFALVVSSVVACGDHRSSDGGVAAPAPKAAQASESGLIEEGGQPVESASSAESSAPSGDCVVNDPWGVKQPQHYSAGAYSGPNPSPEDAWNPTLQAFYEGEGIANPLQAFHDDYALLVPDAVAWFAQEACRTGQWFGPVGIVSVAGVDTPSTLGPSIYNAVTLCHRWKKDGVPGDQMPDGRYPRDLASHLCPSVLK